MTPLANLMIAVNRTCVRWVGQGVYNFLEKIILLIDIFSTYLMSMRNTKIKMKYLILDKKKICHPLTLSGWIGHENYWQFP